METVAEEFYRRIPQKTAAGGRGVLLIIAAPLGAGKMLLRRALLERQPNVRLSISHTSRPAQPHEVHGQDFLFLEKTEFEKRIKEKAFLEHDRIGGHYYGTPRKPLLDDLAAGRDVVATTDTRGARALKKAVPEAVRVFICPPSWGEMSAYLRGRVPQASADMERALKRAREEMKDGLKFEYIMVHDNFKASAETLCAILQAERWSARRGRETLTRLIKTPFTAR